MHLVVGKKRAFLADPGFLKYKGFVVCDESDNGIQLWYLPFDERAKKPGLKACAKHPRTEARGYVLYYTSQCPFCAKYVPVLEKTAKENGVTFRSIHLTDRKAAQNAPTPVTNYALFLDGTYVTNEILSEKKFLKMISG